MARRKQRESRASRRKPRRRGGARGQSRLWGWSKALLLRLSLVLLVVAVAAIAWLDVKIRRQFEGQRWAVPAHVYTRPLEIYAGQRLTRTELLSELKELGYRGGAVAGETGTYAASQIAVDIYSRAFDFWDGPQPAQLVRVNFDGASVRSVQDGRRDVGLFRLEPRLFGSVSTAHHEDRSLVKLDQVPQALIHALLATEDRKFYSHFGVDPMAIGRAMLRNLTAGKVVQGGSTLTQQLVKNFYLTAERTVRRKLTEMVMAILLEVHYSKDEILQAYLNEVYLGQVGNRAIHGFGLGSQFLFGRPLAELSLPEMATLVGIVKGPSYYNPRRHPARARERRDLVLTAMLEEGFISDTQAMQAKQRPLGIDQSNASNARSYPAFMDFVRHQLRRDYRDQDLRNEGLRIFTTLDPRVQSALERAIAQQLKLIETQRKLPADSLQAAAVVVRSDNGELAALAGGRQAQFAGYNRALDSIRPIGSLIKPVVYLAALERPEQYNLATLLDDTEIVVEQRGSPDWAPGNYDGRSHGEVMLIDALAHSYNQATVRLGMELGVETVVDTLRRLGYSGQTNLYPSMLLGAVPMSPLEISNVFLALAAGGFRSPIKSIRSVFTADAEPLARYPLAIEQVVEPGANALITYAMQQVVRDGTARGVGQLFPESLNLAGKTGTTDGFRDSWFAGFSGNYLAVVWVGRDDNRSTGLSGSSGAARVWAGLMKNLDLTPLADPQYPDIVTTFVDPVSGRLAGSYCIDRRELPFIAGYLPEYNEACGPPEIAESPYLKDEAGSSGQDDKTFGSWIKDIFK